MKIIRTDRPWTFLLLIPIQLVLGYLWIQLTIHFDAFLIHTGRIQAPPVGHPMPVFTIISVIFVVILTIIVSITSIVLTIVYTSKKRRKKNEPQTVTKL